MDKSFEDLLDNITPFLNKQYWKDLDEGINVDYETIKKLSKLKKYQKEEFIKDNNINSIELSLSELELDKKQFKIFTNISFKKEKEAKQKFQNAVAKLLEAKEDILNTHCDILATRTFSIKSGIFSDKQLVNSNVRLFMTQPLSNITSNKFWNIEKKQKIREYNLTEDVDFGKHAKK